MILKVKHWRDSMDSEPKERIEFAPNSVEKENNQIKLIDMKEPDI